MKLLPSEFMRHSIFYRSYSKGKSSNKCSIMSRFICNNEKEIHEEDKKKLSRGEVEGGARSPLTRFYRERLNYCVKLSDVFAVRRAL